ncbi:CerR family C-terminal domain-containing protein [Caenispirillum salinarum]|uniref:CerR family C-terminal domain-containing protein n=1 Tax=Caenispirillum salinarum TaxID=859058 RepID=UPI000A001E40|nr:CerR family C-terminal domain-containing protein [Caenispirillum salinarum]
MDQPAPRDSRSDLVPEGHAPSARGEETRQRLLSVALRVFGRDGYDGVSTRRIAAAAEANVAAIAYHFGGKRGLYLAVARSVAERNAAFVRPMEARVAETLAEAAGDRAALGRVLGRVVLGLMAGLGSAREDGRALFILRELMMPSEAFDLLHEAFFLPLNRALAAIAGAALELPPDHPTAIMRGHLLIGSVMPLIAAREVVERRLDRAILTGGAWEETATAAVASGCASLGLPAPDVCSLAED